MLEFLLLDDMNVSITIDGIRLKSNLNINQTLKFIKKSFFLHKVRIYSITLLSFRKYRWTSPIDCGIIDKQ